MLPTNWRPLAIVLTHPLVRRGVGAGLVIAGTAVLVVLAMLLYARDDVAAAVEFANRVIVPAFAIAAALAFLTTGPRQARRMTGGFVVAYVLVIAGRTPHLRTETTVPALAAFAVVAATCAALVALLWVLARRTEPAADASTSSTASAAPQTGEAAGPDRKRAMERLGQLVELAGRHDRPLSVAIIDIDDVSTARAAGDGPRIVAEVEATIAALLRTSDLAARWGADSFVAVLPETPAAHALATMQRVSDIVRTRIARTDASPVTVSIGIAQRRLADTPDELIDRAWQAMEAARHGGLEVDAFGLQPPGSGD